MVSLGIDIGGSGVKVARSTRGPHDATHAARTGRSRRYARPSPEVLRDAVREAAGEAGWRGGGEVCAIGVCLPGVLDEARAALAVSANLPQLVGVPLAPLLAETLGVSRPQPRVTFFSDANATAYDLYASRNLTGRLFLLAIGTGVGAAVVDEGGRFLHVSGDSPGHFGQVDVSLEDDPPVGPDGGAGGLEAYLSAAALSPRYGADPLRAAAALSADDPPALALARAVRIAHALYRPHHVCLAGGLGVRMGHLLPALGESIRKRLTFLARHDWTFSTGEHDFHAACGAARLAAEAKT